MVMTSSDLWDEDTAERYDDLSAEMFAPEVLDPAVDFLAALAGCGPALELAIGTGRVAIPLADRGVPVTGIELSQPMVDQLRRKASADKLPVVIGDMATATVPGSFSLVYVVWNSIGNLCTQDEQVQCFRNAAGHLSPGGRFVVELWVPGIRRFPPGQAAVPFEVTDRHAGFDTLDTVSQRGTSHHYWRMDDGSTRYGSSNFRYIWPAECDLMAALAGLEPEQRMADWDGAPFTSDSESHISIWRKPLDASDQE
jgi:SAM-dependent methyltransferase